MLFISPPFGNYIEISNCISIKGSFTLESRDGLYSQILKTLRYSFEYNGWINKIGLRNKGIDYAIDDYKKNKSKFIYNYINITFLKINISTLLKLIKMI